MGLPAQLPPLGGQAAIEDQFRPGQLEVSQAVTSFLMRAVGDLPQSPTDEEIGIQGFHHIGLFAEPGQADLVSDRYEQGMGMVRTFQAADTFGSRVLETGGVRVVIGAPRQSQRTFVSDAIPFREELAERWVKAHGLGVHTIAVNVESAQRAYDQVTGRGAQPVYAPRSFHDAGGALTAAAAMLYTKTDHRDFGHPQADASQLGVRMVFVEGADQYDGFFPGFDRVEGADRARTFGIHTADHMVCNTYSLLDTTRMLARRFGLHVMASFFDGEVGTPHSGLNSVVMASNDNRLLMPVNDGVDRVPGSPGQINRSIIDSGDYPLIQHVAMQTDDIFGTITKMRAAGVFQFLEPPANYYDDLVSDIGRDRLTRILKRENVSDAQFAAFLADLHRNGILVDRDGEDLLFQIFTKPVADFDKPPEKRRMTLFHEIIQRVCVGDPMPGCGRFGKGNFRALYKALELFQLGGQG